MTRRCVSALAFPKPVGAVDTTHLVRDLDPQERHLLRAVVDHADHVGEIVDDQGRHFTAVLVYLPPWAVRCLHQFEVERGDDLGAYNDGEEEPDLEASLGAPERFAQNQWAAPTDRFGGIDLEADPAEAGEEETDGSDLPYERGRGRRLLPVFEAEAD